MCSSKTKFSALQVSDDQILIIGGKDEVSISEVIVQHNVATDEVEEFNIKDMKMFPGDWRLPMNIAGFSSCQIKSNYKS